MSLQPQSVPWVVFDGTQCPVLWAVRVGLGHESCKARFVFLPRHLRMSCDSYIQPVFRTHTPSLGLLTQTS
ncbi:hypothetical protein PILCRDRAFT_747625 [Piloderma croceum F 1598]|uniref:Uncharacterized protein n=1 Tax=Piloderma croceum (strain F 1598) TaxID=765440 RepID=A0A0C3EV80_PILCF|nr:hypothetical protein PILCRDRAFT_747625 [Piloderma croceum F 1598]